MEFAAERTVLANSVAYAAWMSTRAGGVGLGAGGAAVHEGSALANWALLAVALALLGVCRLQLRRGRLALRAYGPQPRGIEDRAGAVVGWCWGTTVLLLAAALIAIGSTLLLSSNSPGAGPEP